MKELLLSRRVRWVDAVLMILCVVLAVISVRLWVSPAEMLSNTTEVNYSYIARCDQGAFYAIDSGHTRLIAFDEEGNERFDIVDPSDDGETALYIDDVLVDGDDVYLAASEWDGLLVSREVIIAFDSSGTYQGRLYELTYDIGTNRTNKHRIYGLHSVGDDLVWAECTDHVISVRRVGLRGGEPSTLWTTRYTNAFDAVADIVFDRNDLIALNKNGSIERLSHDDDPELLYSTAWPSEEERVPFRLAVSNGACYFTDIYSGSVCRVLRGDSSAEVLLEGTDSQTVAFSADGGKMLLSESNGLRVVDGADETRYATLTIDSRKQMAHVALVACLVGGGVALLLTVLRLVLIFLGALTRGLRVGPVATVAVTFFACSIVAYILIDSFRGLYLDKNREQLQMAAVQVASRITEEELDGVRLARDFESDSYKDLIAIMEESMPLDVDFYHTTYCNILRKDTDGEGGYAIAYRDQSIGTYFPLDEVEAEEVSRVYETSAPVWNDEVLDVSGTYVSVKYPIFGSDGKVVGVVAVGADVSVVNELVAQMQQEVLLSIVLVLLLFWIVATEWIAISSQVQDCRGQLSEGPVVPIHLVRLLVFAIFAAFNLVSSFLPVYVLRQSAAIDEPWRELASTLPLTINIFAMGVMSLFCATAMRRFGMRRVFVGSMACSLVGNIALFTAVGYPAIVVGLLLDGIGVGMITNAIYVVLTYLPDDEARDGAFSTYNGASLSGINFGMILGSIMAVGMGQRTVFLAVAATWLTLMALGLYVARRLDFLVIKEDVEGGESHASISLGRFLGSRPIWSFILLIQNPYIVFNSFAYYFVPLFCDAAGLQETIVSVLLMLYSQTAVMLGDSLTDRVERTMGSRSVYLALALNMAAVALYISRQNFWTLVAALLLLGVSASFAKPCQQALYLRQDASKRLGEDQAMGIYNFSENIGESLGPIVFGSLMNGPIGYVWAFLGAIGFAGAAHFALNREEVERGNEDA